jgi:hypothetical protein
VRGRWLTAWAMARPWVRSQWPFSLRDWSIFYRKSRLSSLHSRFLFGMSQVRISARRPATQLLCRGSSQFAKSNGWVGFWDVSRQRHSTRYNFVIRHYLI